jgi:hypothetical protein
VLFGERDDAVGVIWIDEATGPPPDSQETPQLFLRGTEGMHELDGGKRRRTSGTVGFLGMWHAHPRQSADFSIRDLLGMLELLDASVSPTARGTIIIVGWAATKPQLGAYVFKREELCEHDTIITPHQPTDLPEAATPARDIGLALSRGAPEPLPFTPDGLRLRCRHVGYGPVGQAVAARLGRTGLRASKTP